MEAVTLRAYLKDVIHLADEPQPNTAAKRNAVMEEGLETLSDFAEFDDESIKVLCSSVRKPGGLIGDPMDPDSRISNPGYSIPAICEERMKQAAYAAKIYKSISRPITALALYLERDLSYLRNTGRLLTVMRILRNYQWCQRLSVL